MPLSGVAVDATLGGTGGAMLMKARERWNCMNPARGCQVVVEIGGEVEGCDPRCACGEIMKKKYTSPTLHTCTFFVSKNPPRHKPNSTG
jgi:hypothetical protein